MLWLDASTQTALRQSASLPPLGNRQAVDVWLNGLNDVAHAVQPVADRRPVLVSGDAAAFLRFDGKDDFLALTPGRQLAPAVTIFVLAAPKKNAGMFSAFVSTAETGKNDYTSGLNMDQGPAGTEGLSVVNVESAGAAGFRDLLVPGILGAAERPFGAFHVFTIRSRIGKTGNEVFVDGIKAGERERLESHIGLDEITVGARRYSHDAGQPPHVQGFFAGNMAAVLIYNRALTDPEREKVEQHLMAKMPALHALADGTQGHALEVLANPPLVQMLVPGFTVEELPLRIGNLNNIRYRADGKVVALGYDGRIHLLSDTNGDGLEDRAEPYWDQTTMRGALGIVVSEKDDRHGKGVFVASKGKVSFFPDANGDDRADEEKVVASGWKETFHGVDTLGLARDPKDGSLYFGLGCTNFADGYLIDRNTGKSQYDVKGIRGTIQRLSADFSQQETICTGVRFTCALAFNRAGDLFASEQEGATWLPNGNPFDELLHIERGKHYGFPPRHPKHLPDVVDEPAVMEYGPQHQSTVGMVFNEGVNGGPAFGPKFWEGDVLMCGESRGKLWRTKLVKTPHGYVAQNHLLACLGMLLVDACVTPQGDLLLACHSGPPDWGTGPAGKGRLFKIRYRNAGTPQPVMAWAAALDEFRIAFDRKLDPADWAGAAKKVRIEAGPFVSAGDRYETVRPGYQVVRDQMGAPRRWVEVLGLSMSQDQRTLILRVPRQTQPDGYAVTLPMPQKWVEKRGMEQRAEMDVALTLNGVTANLKPAHGEGITCVLPHPSMSVSKTLCRGSADHETFFEKASSEPTSLSLKALVDSSNPYVPAVQPGAKLDWDASADPFVTVPFTVRHGAQSGGVQVAHDLSAKGSRKPLAITAATPAASAEDFHLEGHGRKSVLGTSRVFVPWTTESRQQDISSSPTLAKVRTDVMGNWMEGRRLFFGQAACFTCHTLRGEGLAFGPDLTNLIHRDRASVLQDILHPSATINPDQFGSLVKMKDGTSLAGIIRAGAGATVKIGLPGGAQMEMSREKVAAIEPMKISLMPEDYGKRLNASQQEDLLTFLLTAPLEPATITRVDPPAPAPRSLKEIASILPPPPSPESRAAWKPLRILLVIDPKDHGVDEHDYPLWLDRWTRLLSLAEKVRVDSCEGFPTAEQLSKADVTVFYSRNSQWDLRTARLLDDYQERGGGLVYLHWAIEGRKHAMPLAERVGLAFSFSKFRHGDMDLEFMAPGHPITKGFPEKLKFTDESYWNLRGEAGRVSLLATSREEQVPQPQLWTLERGKGRVFACIPGHYTWTFDDPLYRLLLLRGICWAAKQEDVERLSELSLIGARVQP